MAYQQNNQKRKNYFAQQIQNNGVDFIEKLRDDQLQRDSIRIFRDIARGNISIDEYGEYFLNPKLINAAISAAYSKFVLFGTSKVALELLMNTPGKSAEFPDAPQIFSYHLKGYEAYSLILNTMTNLKNTNNIEYLYVMANNLTKYRYDI